MSLKKLRSSVRIQLTCNFNGCGFSKKFSGEDQRAAEKKAEAAGWKQRSSGSSWSPRIDWCKAHWELCPTCKGKRKLHPMYDDGSGTCDCIGTFHGGVERCVTCSGMGIVLDDEPKQ